MNATHQYTPTELHDARMCQPSKCAECYKEVKDADPKPRWAESIARNTVALIGERWGSNGTFAWADFGKPRPRQSVWRIYVPLALAALALIALALLNLRGV